MKHIFIINPKAGKSNAAETLPPLIRAAAQELQLDVEIVQTQRRGHATELAHAAAQAGPVRLYACGGDGTLNEVLCGAYGFPDVEVGHIPCGSGNDMIRNFGKAVDFLNIGNMLQGTSRTIDLLRVNGRVAASICAAGLDAKVAHNVHLFRRIPFCGGSTAYNLAVIKCLCGKLGYHMTVDSDAGHFEGNYLLTAIGNGSYYGGGYCSLPGARTDDGTLHVVLVDKIPLLRIAKVLGRYKAGTHFTEDGQVAPDLADIITSFETETITIQSKEEFYYTIDGECEPARSIQVEILKGAGRFILPRGLKAKHDKD